VGSSTLVTSLESVALVTGTASHTSVGDGSSTVFASNSTGLVLDFEVGRLASLTLGSVTWAEGAVSGSASFASDGFGTILSSDGLEPLSSSTFQTLDGILFIQNALGAMGDSGSTVLSGFGALNELVSQGSLIEGFGITWFELFTSI
jgi:hypothetical protein